MKPKPLLLSLSLMIAVLMVLSAFGGNDLREDEIDNAFGRDYDQVAAVAEYLLEREENILYIDFSSFGSGGIKGEYGAPLKFHSEEIEQIAGELKKKGYYHITKQGNAVIFDVWRKPFYAEFESGFAYSDDGTGDLSMIQFLTGQRPLPKENWYYYEADYNEWRSNQSAASRGSGGE